VIRLSIVTVNYRTWEVLGEGVRALRASGGIPDGVEWIVVDNASPDGDPETFAREFPEVRIVRAASNHGFAAGCNLGAGAARGEALLFLNPDVRATREDLERLLETRQRRRDVALLTTRQVDARGRPQKAFDAFPTPLYTFRWARVVLRRLRPGSYSDARSAGEAFVEVDWVSGSVLLIGSAALAQLGGWDEGFFMYLEDVDLCRRARDRGLRAGYEGSITFEHRHGAASRRDEPTAVMSRCELLVSHHLYAHKHARGLERVLFHGALALRAVPALSLAAVLDLATLGRVPSLRVRRKVLGALLAHYLHVARSGSWVSRRSARAHRR
jgi:N-acetylglucosaminyl-diphospho-decaprenol L-rhamnosyltransferase